MKPRSLLKFQESIKSEKTLKNYSDHLRRFCDYYKILDSDELLSFDIERLQIMIEDYVIHLKNTINPNSVPIYMTGVRHFCIMNRLMIHWEIVNKMFPEKIKRAGSLFWKTEQVQKMLESTSSKRNRALVHFLASTGGRIGVLDYDLKLKHLVEMPNSCKAILLYPDSKDEYWAFLTPEASQLLNEYFDERKHDHEEFTPETPLFRIVYQLGIAKSKQLHSAGAKTIIYRLINKSRVERTRVNRHFDIQMDHGFRKRFNTILKLENDVNSNIAEKIMGHKNGLDGVYFKPTREQCFTEFLKAVPELTISPVERQKMIIENQQREISELDTSNEKIERLEKSLKRVTDVMFASCCDEDAVQNFREQLLLNN